MNTETVKALDCPGEKGFTCSDKPKGGKGLCERCYDRTYKRTRPEQRRRYYQENRDQILEQKRQYREEHKDAISEQQHRYREEHREDLRRAQRRYVQENLSKVRESNRRYYWENLDAKREYGRAYYRENKEERLKAANRYYQQHRDDRLEYRRRWVRDNPEKAAASRRRGSRQRRARERDALHIPFTDAELSARLSMFAGCWMCGGEADTVDHLIPLARGGPHCLSNLRPACGSCNASKGAKTPQEWAEVQSL